MKKRYCRRVNIIDYEYFPYDGTEEGKQKALEWLKSFESDAELGLWGGEWKLCSRRCGSCISLDNHPSLLLRPKGCDEIYSDSLSSLGRDYKVLGTDELK